MDGGLALGLRKSTEGKWFMKSKCGRGMCHGHFHIILSQYCGAKQHFKMELISEDLHKESLNSH